MKKIKSTIDNLFNKKNRKNNSGRYKTYNVSTLDDLVDELDNPAKQERVLANQVKKKKYEKWCLTFGYDIQHQICIPEGMFKMLWLYINGSIYFSRILLCTWYNTKLWDLLSTTVLLKKVDSLKP